MPYLIEKSYGDRTLVDMTADEARYRAQSVRVIEVDDDGTEIGDVQPECAETQDDPKPPAAKKAAKVKG